MIMTVCQYGKWKSFSELLQQAGYMLELFSELPVPNWTRIKLSTLLKADIAASADGEIEIW